MLLARIAAAENRGMLPIRKLEDPELAHLRAPATLAEVTPRRAKSAFGGSLGR